MATKENNGAAVADEKAIVRIDKWDGSAVKNALDDAAKGVLTDKYEYQESHCLLDGRLMVCTVAVGFAMFALLWDYLHPFPQSRPVLIICVVSYFVMMGVLTVYTSYMEKGCFAVVVEKDKAGVDPDNEWRLTSNLKRYDDMYHLQIDFVDGSSKDKRSATMEKSVGNFFDESGRLCTDLFETEIVALHSTLLKNKKTQ